MNRKMRALAIPLVLGLTSAQDAIYYKFESG